MNEIRQLIAKGRLQEALEALAKAAPTYLQDEVPQLQSRLNSIERKERLGLLANSNIGIEKNRITNAALQLCQEIASNTVEEIQPPAPPLKSKEYKLANVHRLLNTALNDESLQTFCLLHFEEVYNNFAVGQTKAQRILTLLDYVKRNAAMNQLLQLLQTEHPVQYEQHQPYF